MPKRRNWDAAKTKVRDEGMCRMCASTDILDPAHIIPRSLGGGMESNDVVPLCRSCHSEYDAQRLDLLPILTREEQVRAVELVGIARAYRIITGDSNERYNHS